MPPISDEVRTGIKLGVLAVIGVYALPFLVGLLCTGAMLLTGYLLAALQ